MTQHSDDLVMVATGGLIEVPAWADVLQGAGILYRVVGDDPTAVPGTAPPTRSSSGSAARTRKRPRPK